MRKLINPSNQMIFLSNTCSAIPIIETLKNLKVKITIPVTALKTGFQLDKCSHLGITSFQRQIFLNPEDFHSLQINFRILGSQTSHIASNAKQLSAFCVNKADTNPEYQENIESSPDALESLTHFSPKKIVTKIIIIIIYHTRQKFLH